MAARRERASSLVLMFFGAGYLVYNTRYPLDTSANPGPGVFPLIVGGSFVVLAAWQLVQSFRLTKSPRIPLFQIDRGETKPFFMIVLFIAYLIAIKWIGFFSSSFFFVILSSRLMGARDWARPVVLSIGVGLFCYVLFEVWLKLSLPGGILF